MSPFAAWNPPCISPRRRPARRARAPRSTSEAATRARERLGRGGPPVARGADMRHVHPTPGPRRPTTVADPPTHAPARRGHLKAGPTPPTACSPLDRLGHSGLSLARGAPIPAARSRWTRFGTARGELRALARVEKEGRITGSWTWRFCSDRPRSPTPDGPPIGGGWSRRGGGRRGLARKRRRGSPSTWPTRS